MPKNVAMGFCLDSNAKTDTPLRLLAQSCSVGQAQLEPFGMVKQVPGIGYLTIERPRPARGVPPCPVG